MEMSDFTWQYQKYASQKLSRNPCNSIFNLLSNQFFQVTENNTNDGRTSKHSEYDYTEKCQTFLWKCQISPGNTRNIIGQIFMQLLLRIYTGRTSKHSEYEYAEKCRNFPMEMSDSTGQHQKYSRPEIYIVTLVLQRLYTESKS